MILIGFSISDGITGIALGGDKNTENEESKIGSDSISKNDNPGVSLEISPNLPSEYRISLSTLHYSAGGLIICDKTTLRECAVSLYFDVSGDVNNISYSITRFRPFSWLKFYDKEIEVVRPYSRHVL